MPNYYGDLMRLAKIASVKYQTGRSCTDELGRMGEMALDIIATPGVVTMEQGSLAAGGVIKHYTVKRFSNNISRPIRTDIFEPDPTRFLAVWQKMVASFDPTTATASYEGIDRVLYSALMGFAVAVDLHSPGSRKTAGSFFEILMGSLLADVTGLPRYNQISIPDSPEKVTTDVFLEGRQGQANLVVATKTTTRERIVQVWAHQRILDNIYGRGNYRSILIAASELRRDDQKTSVQEICVPGQVKLYQKHLAQLYGVYYLDPPFGYSTESFRQVVPVTTVQTLFSSHLNALLTKSITEPLRDEVETPITSGI